VIHLLAQEATKQSLTYNPTPGAVLPLTHMNAISI